MPIIGYVKLHRQFLESDLWKAEPFTKGQAWIDLFGLANHKPGTAWIRGVEVRIDRGQVARSEVTWSKRWKWSRKKVRNFLKYLEKEHQIEQQKTNVTSLITILNYDQYQGEDTAEYTPEGTAKEQQKNSKGYTNNNDKNNKNEKNIVTFTGNLSETSGSDASRPAPCPHKKIKDLYNKILGQTLPFCKKTDSTINNNLRARWREDEEYQSIEWWESYFKSISEMDFLMGRTRHEFYASFDWVVRPRNFSKIINGNYKNRDNTCSQDDLEQYAKEHGYA